MFVDVCECLWMCMNVCECLWLLNHTVGQVPDEHDQYDDRRCRRDFRPGMVFMATASAGYGGSHGRVIDVHRQPRRGMLFIYGAFAATATAGYVTIMSPSALARDE